MNIESTRFGTFEVSEENILDFPHPLAGFPQTSRYVLVAQSPEHNLAWLHSVDEADLAFPVVQPGFFFSDYEVVVDDDSEEKLNVADGDDLLVLAIVSIKPGEPEQATANLLAPVVINMTKRQGLQVLNQIPSDLRAPLFAEGTTANGPALGERAELVTSRI